MLFNNYLLYTLAIMGVVVLSFQIVWLIKSNYQEEAAEAAKAKIIKIRNLSKVKKIAKRPTDKKDKKTFIKYYFHNFLYINEYLVKVEYKYGEKTRRKSMILNDNCIKREKIKLMMSKGMPLPIFVNKKVPWAIRINIFGIPKYI